MTDLNGNEITVEVPVKHWYQSRQIQADALQFVASVVIGVLGLWADDKAITYVALAGILRAAFTGFFEAAKREVVTGLATFDTHGEPKP